MIQNGCLYSRADEHSSQLNLKKTLAWNPYIQEDLDFVNKKRVRHVIAMGIAPDKAEASFETAKEGMEPTDKAVSAFVL